jgi:hypothetical protein
VFQPPIQKPEGSRDDDRTCSNQSEKPDCDDCGGNNPLGLCANANQQNCKSFYTGRQIQSVARNATTGPCEEQNCPKDGPPKCQALECSGNVSRSHTFSGNKTVCLMLNLGLEFAMHLEGSAQGVPVLPRGPTNMRLRRLRRKRRRERKVQSRQIQRLLM